MIKHTYVNSAVQNLVLEGDIMPITYKDFPEEVVNKFDIENYSEKEIIDSIFGVWCLNSWSSGVEGLIRHKFYNAKANNEKEITISIDQAEKMVIYNDRMQEMFCLLWNHWRDSAQ